MKLTLVFIFFTQMVLAQAWFQWADFPGSKRDDGVCVVLDNKAYIGTGLQEWSATIDFYSFDLNSLNWSAIPNMPNTTERQYACAFPGNGCFYVFGGDGVGGALANMYKYNVTGSIWNAVSSKPGNGLIGASCMSFGNKVVIIGGKLQSGKVSKEVWEYDLTTDSWTQKNDLPFAGRWRASAVVWNNAGYLMFGRDSSGSFPKEIYSYSPVNDQWTYQSNIPFAGRAYSSLNVAANKIIAFGGIDSLGNYYKDIHYFYPFTSSWLQGPDLPSTPRKGGMSCAYGDLFVYTCGIEAGDKRTTETWITDIPLGLKEQSFKQAFSVYPNPTGEDISIRLVSGEGFIKKSFCLTDLSGKTVIAGNFVSEEMSVNLEDFEAGVYFLSLFSDQQLLEVKKVLKR